MRSWILIPLFWSQVFAQSCIDVSPRLPSTGVYGFPTFASWHSDGVLLAYSDDNGIGGIWDSDSLITIRNLTFLPPSSPLSSLLWIPGGNQVAVQSQTSVTIWDAATGIIVQNLTSSLRELSVCSTLLATSSSGSVLLWSTASWTLIQNISAFADAVKLDASCQSFAVAFNSSLIITLWSTNGTTLQSFVGGCFNMALALSTNGDLLAVSCPENVEVLDTRTGATVANWAHTGLFVSVMFSHDGYRVMALSSGLHIFDIALNQLEQILPRVHCDRGALSSLSVFACPSSRGSLFLWDVSSGPTITRWKASNRTSIAWSPAGLLAYTIDNEVRVYDNGRHRTIANINEASSLGWSPDGSLLAVVDSSGNLTVVELATLLLLRSFSLGSLPPFSIAWHRSGKIALSRNYELIIVDANTGIILQQLAGFLFTPPSWSLDGTQVANFAYLWNLTTGTSPPSTPTKGYAFSPEGVLATFSPGSVVVESANFSTSIVIFALHWGTNGMLWVFLDAAVGFYDVYSGTTTRQIAVPITVHDLALYNMTFAYVNRDPFTGRVCISLSHVSSVPTLNSVVTSDTISLQVSGVGLDNTGYKWLDATVGGVCKRISLDSNLTAQIPLTPGIYTAALYDRYSDTEPLHAFSPFAANCPPGTQLASAVCENCPNGTYQANESLSACPTCLGLVSKNRTKCDLCPISSRPIDFVCVCSINFYPIPLLNDGLLCQPCPDVVAVCDGLTVKASDGYWRTTDSGVHFLPCLNNACRNGKCEDSYTGALCGECMPGFGQTGYNECSKCGSGASQTAVAVILVLVLIVVCVVLTWLSLRANPTQPNVMASVFKVGLSAAQLNSLLLRTGLGLPVWLSETVSVLDGVSGVNTLTLSLSCVFLAADVRREDVFFAYSRFVLLLPLCGLAFFALLLCVWHLKRTSKAPQEASASKTRLRLWFITGSATVLFTFHPTIVLATFRMFACRAVDLADTDLRLSSDVSARCFDTQYMVHLCLVGIPMFIFYVVLPPLVAFLYLRRIPKEHVLDTTKNMLLFLCLEYHSEHYWWFLVVILRKVIGVGILAFSSGTLQLSLMIIMVVSFFLAHLLVRPYSTPLHIADIAEITSLLSSSFIFSLAQLFVFDNTSKEAQGAGVVVILILVTFYGFLIWVAGKQCKARVQEIRNQTEIVHQKDGIALD